MKVWCAFKSNKSNEVKHQGVHQTERYSNVKFYSLSLFITIIMSFFFLMQG